MIEVVQVRHINKSSVLLIVVRFWYKIESTVSIRLVKRIFLDAPNREASVDVYYSRELGPGHRVDQRRA